MRILCALVVVFGVMSVTACNDGHHGSDGYYYTHEDLANRFREAVNLKFGENYDLSIAKLHTEQDRFVVFYNAVTAQYEAYSMVGYDPAKDVSLQLNNILINGAFALNLDQHGDRYLYDYTAPDGNNVEVWFEKTRTGSKDLALVKAMKEELVIRDAVESIQVEYGLSESRSRRWAEVVYKMESTPDGSLTDEQIDNMSEELVGSSISDIKADIKAGNQQSLSDRIARAGQINDGMTPEQINEVIQSVFNR